MLTTKGVGEHWFRDSVYLSSKVLENINRLNPTNFKQPHSILRRSALEDGRINSVYPVTYSHPPAILVHNDDEDDEVISGELTVFRGIRLSKNKKHECWKVKDLTADGSTTSSPHYQAHQVWSCCCCCCG